MTRSFDIQYRQAPGGMPMRGAVATTRVGRDGPTAVYVPVTANDWLKLALVSPTLQWNCQEASGSLAPAIGAISLAPLGGAQVYAAKVAGWTRNFVGFSAEDANARFATTDASMDAATGQSVAWLIYAAVQLASASTRTVLQVSDSPTNSIRVSTTAIAHLHNNLVTPVVTTIPSLTTVLPYLWYRNATTNVSGLILPGDHTLAGTHDESAFTATTTKALGGNGVACAIARYGLAATWYGPAAEAIAVPATLTTLGW